MTLAEIQSMRTTARAKLEDLIGRTGDRELSTEEKQIMADLTAEGQRLGGLETRYAALESFDRPTPTHLVRRPLDVTPKDSKAAVLAALDDFLRTGKQATDTPLQIQQSPVNGAAAAVRTDVVDQVIIGTPIVDVPGELGVTEYPRESTNPLVVSILGGAPASTQQNEGAAMVDSTPGTYLTRTLQGLRYNNLTKVSLESIMNVAFPLVSSVIQALTIGQIQSQNTVFWTKLKTALRANPHCYVDSLGNDAYSSLVRLKTGLTALWQNLPENRFLLSSSTLLSLLDLRDTLHRPLLDVTNNTLVGKPYIVSDDIDAGYVCYGNFILGAYRSRSPLYVQVLRELFAPSFVGYSAYQFTDFAFYAELLTLTKQPVVFTTLSVNGVDEGS